MQNKAKYLDDQMNVSPVTTKDYENKTLGEHGKNEPKTNPIRTQTNPIKPNQSQYEPKTNPIRTQSKPISKAKNAAAFGWVRKGLDRGFPY